MAKNAYEERIRPNLDKIVAWAKKGATSKEIASKLEMSYSTFRRYVAAGEQGDELYRELAEAFARAREEPDDNVEAALYKRACGFECVEIKKEQKLTKDGNIVELTIETKRIVPPDPTSAMFWLTNRRPEKWKYKPAEKDDVNDGCGGVVMLSPIMTPPKEGDIKDG